MFEIRNPPSISPSVLPGRSHSIEPVAVRVTFVSSLLRTLLFFSYVGMTKSLDFRMVIYAAVIAAYVTCYRVVLLARTMRTCLFLS